MDNTTHQGVGRFVGWLHIAASWAHALSVRGKSRGSQYQPEAQASLYVSTYTLAGASGWYFLYIAALTLRLETGTDALFFLKQQRGLLSQKLGPPGGHRKKRKNRNACKQTTYRLEYCAHDRILRGKKIEERGQESFVQSTLRAVPANDS